MAARLTCEPGEGAAATRGEPRAVVEPKLSDDQRAALVLAEIKLVAEQVAAAEAV